jgi:GNAT superfamily N-acetyltransferase
MASLTQADPAQSNSTDLRFTLASPSDENLVVSIYTEIGTWLHQSKGITGQWFKQLSCSDARHFINTGELYVVFKGEDNIGALRLSAEPDHLWTDCPAIALYLHSLAVRRAFAGQDLGRTMLAWAEEQAKAAGKSYLRLDCMAGNSYLRRYYTDAGYTPLGIHPQHRFFALFEKPVAPKHPMGD